MSITNGYATLPELRSWLGTPDTSNDTMLENAVTSVSRWIDQFCGRHFWQATAQARTFPSPCDMRTLDLGPFNDLVALTSLKTDEAGDGVFETTWSTGDYELLPISPTSAPELRPYTKIRSTGLGRLFPVPIVTGRTARVEVTGTWGWSAIPQAVNQACLIQSARVFKRKDAIEGTIGFAEFGVVRMQGRLDPDVQALLAPYRRTAVLVA